MLVHGTLKFVHSYPTRLQQLVGSFFFSSQIKYTEELGIEAGPASKLFIYLGISTFLARPLSGLLCSIPRIKPQYVFQAALLINGVSTILLPLIESYSQLIAYVVVYGACDGIYISMLNVLVLNSIEAERRASAFGVELFLTALTTLVGPPIAGRYMVA